MKNFILFIFLLCAFASCKTQETAESVISGYQNLDILILRYSPGDSVIIYPNQDFQIAYPFVTVINSLDTIVVEDHVAIGR
jgi:hypothetical protein